MNIAFDLDGVLVDLYRHWHPIVQAVTGIDVSKPTQYDIDKEFGISKRILRDTLRAAYKLHRYTPIYPGVVELLLTLHRHTSKPIQIITAREAEFAESTLRLVKRFGVPCNVSFSDFNGKLKYLSGIDFFVEDRGETAVHLADNGITVFLVDRSYNQGFEHENIMRIHGDWAPHLLLYMKIHD